LITVRPSLDLMDTPKNLYDETGGVYGGQTPSLRPRVQAGCSATGHRDEEKEIQTDYRFMASIAKTILEGHGGRIWAEAVPNKGSVFSFTLPKQ
jgi:hypothetical protein